MSSQSINPKGLWVIVPAAGSSQRFKASTATLTHTQFNTLPNKLLLPLPTGRLVLQEVVWRLGRIPCVAGIVVLTSADNQEAIATLLANPTEPLIPTSKRLLLTVGGDTRRASVLAGLEAVQLADANAEFVAVQDAARPCVDERWLEEAFHNLQQMMPDGVVGICAGTKVFDTLKTCVTQPPATQTTDALGQKRPLGFMPVITKTVDRTPFWQVQTPQLFSFPALLAAHHAVPSSAQVTDDAQLIELADAGGVVVVKESSAWNIKLTTWSDYQVLEQIL